MGGGVIEGRHVCLRPLLPPDYDIVLALALDHPLSWPWHGPPSAESFTASLWDDVLDQRLIAGLGGEPFGVVAAYAASAAHGHAYLRVHLVEPGRPAAIEGVLLFLHLLFERHRLRKVYVQSTDASLEQYRAGAERVLEIEGRLVGHLLVDGQPIDLVLAAIHRASWQEAWQEFAPLILVGVAAGTPQRSDAAR